MNMTLENCSEWQELIFETAISVIHVRSTAGLFLVWKDVYLVLFFFGIRFRAHLNCAILCRGSLVS
jgi:hypothetical protein